MFKSVLDNIACFPKFSRPGLSQGENQALKFCSDAVLPGRFSIMSVSPDEFQACAENNKIGKVISLQTLF